MKFTFAFFFLACLFLACESDPKSTTPQSPVSTYVSTPTADTADLASYTRTQVAFGPRVPNSKAHEAFRLWVSEQFTIAGLSVTIDSDPVTLFNKTKTKAYNITASYRPELKRRILLAAHYDTRMIADQDTERMSEPIDGANDGASGVSVLLDIASSLKAFPLPNNIGLDIVLFDVEDQGAPSTSEVENSAYTWCLGSQVWAQKNIAKAPEYLFGILLDMVGGKNAYFLKEGYSMNFAPQVVNEVWNTAQSMGYGSLFQNKQVNGVVDDHIFVQSIAKIPMIDIIQYDEPQGFNPTWHTHNDNIENLDFTIMQSVANVVHKVIRKENP